MSMFTALYVYCRNKNRSFEMLMRLDCHSRAVDTGETLVRKARVEINIRTIDY